MFKLIKKNSKPRQEGNVLFLILIAVALFAALSYAVTSSTRSGGGNANEESSLVRSASVTQYPSGVRTSIIRMMVSNSVDAADLDFSVPSAMGSGAACDDSAGDEIVNCVFHPTGGGASLGSVPADLMTSGAAGQWYFSANYRIEDVGTNATDGTGNEIIAFLPGITNALCDKINEELGIGADETNAGTFAVDTDAFQMDQGYSIPGSATDVIGDTPGDASLTGQPYGCLKDAAQNIYYHALIER